MSSASATHVTSGLVLLPAGASGADAAPSACDSVVLSYLDDCEAAVLHASLRATLVELTRSRVALAPVSGLVTVTGCVECDISVACVRLSVSNCRDCRFYVDVAGGGAAVDATDSSGLAWAPLNVECAAFADSAGATPIDTLPSETWSAHAPTALIAASDADASGALLTPFGREKARELYRALVPTLAATVDEEEIGTIASALGLSTIAVCMHVAPPVEGIGSRLDFAQFEALLAKRAPSEVQLCAMLGAVGLTATALPRWTLGASADAFADATAEAAVVEAITTAPPTPRAAARAAAEEPDSPAAAVVADLVTEAIDAAITHASSSAEVEAKAAEAAVESGAASAEAAATAAPAMGVAPTSPPSAAGDADARADPPQWFAPFDSGVAAAAAAAKKAAPKRRAATSSKRAKKQSTGKAEEPRAAWGAAKAKPSQRRANALAAGAATGAATGGGAAAAKPRARRRVRTNYDFEHHLHLVLKTPGYAAYLRQKLALDSTDGVTGGEAQMAEEVAASKFTRTLNRAPFHVHVTLPKAIELFGVLCAAAAAPSEGSGDAAEGVEIAVVSVGGDEGGEGVGAKEEATPAAAPAAAPAVAAARKDPRVDAATLRRYLVQLKRSAEKDVLNVKQKCAKPISTWGEWREKKSERRRAREKALKGELKRGLAGEAFSLSAAEVRGTLRSWALLSEEQVAVEIEALLETELGEERACSGGAITKENEAKLRTRVTKEVTSPAFDLKLFLKFVSEHKLNTWPLKQRAARGAGRSAAAAAPRVESFQEWITKRNESRRRQQEEVQGWLNDKQRALQTAQHNRDLTFVVVSEFARELTDIVDQAP